MPPPRLYRIVLLGLLLSWLAGCASVVVCPAQVSTPRTVQLLEHGRHSTLLLTSSDQARVRYAYADWAWYVEQDERLGTGMRALLSPSRAALGRQWIAPARPDQGLDVAVGVGIGQAYQLTVDATRVDALIDSLERQFHASPAQPHFSAARNLAFVPHPRPYTFAYNSNHMVADWLRELGCQVRGNPALGRWQVDAAVDSG